ncbi:MAG: cystathionine gamma-synthase [Acidimicrobiia bacterium]|nr:cystathionine gamma-synthase [Acidimicrobiia bacterium]
MSSDHFETRAIHVGQEPDEMTGAVNVPIYATSTYAQDAPGEHRGYEYSRTDNPTRHALEVALASLEGVDPEANGGTISAGSGMAATALIGYMLKPGDHIVLPNDAYGGTFRFFARVLSEHGVEWTAADMTASDGLAEALQSNTKLVWIETPTNPMLRIVDLGARIEEAHAAGVKVCVDNTFATPFLTRPIDHGADLVLHSMTKYLGGHSDVVGGAIVTGDAELHERLKFLQNAVGPVLGPFDAYLTLRGMKTLALRMERHSRNAMAIAQFLEGHEKVSQVIYPGLDSHPQHELAARQMADFGGMVSFRMKDGPDSAFKMTRRTELFFLAESLGGVESLIEVPAAMTHMSVEGTELEVPSDLVRLSVGIEHVDDLIADLEQALA